MNFQDRRVEDSRILKYFSPAKVDVSRKLLKINQTQTDVDFIAWYSQAYIPSINV